MKILDLLRKLGIFRSGTVKAKYHNAKEMPLPFLDQSVYNEKKDLTTKKDLKKLFSSKRKK
jgi:hypothetical protein